MNRGDYPKLIHNQASGRKIQAWNVRILKKRRLIFSTIFDILVNLRERLKSAITFDFYAARDIYYEGTFNYGSKIDRRSMSDTNSIPLRSAKKQ